jgi:cytochrome c oxidase cbb3-type subunit 3
MPTSSPRSPSPRQGVMPAWGGSLGETTVKQLAVYVHGLGGGQ